MRDSGVMARALGVDGVSRGEVGIPGNLSDRGGHELLEHRNSECGELAMGIGLYDDKGR